MNELAKNLIVFTILTSGVILATIGGWAPYIVGMILCGVSGYFHSKFFEERKSYHHSRPNLMMMSEKFHDHINNK